MITRQDFSDFWASLLGLVPEILWFLIIVIIGYIVAKVVQWTVDKVLTKAKANRLFSRNIEKATSRRVTWNIIEAFSRIAFWIILLCTGYLATGVFGTVNNPFFAFFNAILGFIFPGLIFALILIILAVAAAGVVRSLVASVLDGLSYGRVVANTAGMFILGIGILMALTQVGIAVAFTVPLYLAFLVAVVGVVVVGVGGALIPVVRPRLARLFSTLTNEVEVAKPIIQSNLNSADSEGPPTTV